MSAAMLAALAAGKSSVVPGQQNYTSNGSWNFTVPAYNSLTVVVNGAGGGGLDGPDQVSAGDGGYSRFGTSVTGYGGQGANPGGLTGIPDPPVFPPIAGANGTASGGDINTTGGANNGGSGGQFGATGGDGGQAIKTYVPGNLVVGNNVAIVVGNGGAHVAGTATDGADGAVLISWE